MGKKLAKVLAFCIPVIIIAIVIFSLNHGSSKTGDAWGEGSPSQKENVESRNPSQEENALLQTENPVVRMKQIIMAITLI